MGKLVSTAGSFAAQKMRMKPGARKCCPLTGETKFTKRPPSDEGSDPTTTVARFVTEPTLLIAVRLYVRVPVTVATREVVPRTLPIPLLMLKPVAPVTFQCNVAGPF